MAIASRLLRLTLFSLYLHVVLTQRLPYNNCGRIFQYHRQGNQWLGLLTPPQDGLKNISWVVQLIAHNTNLPDPVSGFGLYPDKETVDQVFFDGGRVQSFISFQGYKDELPKVARIQLNGEELCSANEYATNPKTSQVKLDIGFMPHNKSVQPEETTRSPTVIVLTPSASECGVEGLTGLQYGGQVLPRGRFPWLAALYYDTSNDLNKIELDYKCVTTVISARTVITAAHCIYGFTPAQLRVYVGRHDVTMHPERNAVLMSVESVRTHPDYVGTVVPDSDVGLLVLTESMRFTNTVRPICLWTSSTAVGINDNEEMAVAGWGIDEHLKPTRFPSTVNVRAVSREQCLREMLTAKDFLTPRTICAGNSQGHGPCLGDSGGGLMVLRDNRWFVRGIVSLAKRVGNGCDSSGYVIYCDVARHISWIEENIVR